MMTQGFISGKHVAIISSSCISLPCVLDPINLVSAYLTVTLKLLTKFLLCILYHFHSTTFQFTNYFCLTTVILKFIYSITFLINILVITFFNFQDSFGSFIIHLFLFHFHHFCSIISHLFKWKLFFLSL